MATNGIMGHSGETAAAAVHAVVDTDSSHVAAAPAAAGAATNSAGADLSKDEVGWYFVEQYYTTLSKTPDKLHLFYSKRSQFVGGKETEVVNVAVGRQGIQERIKELEFRDCKVRISNVDSQSSFENILICVIGELSIDNGEPNKFTQTFILAKQPSGYFVLNDMLRFLNEDLEDDLPAETGTTASTEAATEQQQQPLEEALAPVDARAEPESESVTEIVPDLKPEVAQSVVSEKAEEPTGQEEGLVNGTDMAVETTEPTEAAPVMETAEPAEPAEEVVPAEVPVETAAAVTEKAATVAREIAEEDIKEAEKPKDPAPTPALRPAPAPEPIKMTWASRAAAAAAATAAAGNARPAAPRAVTPAIPITPRAPNPSVTSQSQPQPSGQQQQQQQQPQQQPSSQQQAAPTAAVTTPAPAEAATPAPANEASSSATEWQTAGSDYRRQYRPQSFSDSNINREGRLGYVKNVTDRISRPELEEELNKYGRLIYFDINRAKTCAFIEYEATAELEAAKAASPLFLGKEKLEIEDRKPKPSYGGGYGGSRGSSRGRGGWDNRDTRDGGGGGGYSRGRGSMRGRGAMQTA